MTVLTSREVSKTGSLRVFSFATPDATQLGPEPHLNHTRPSHCPAFETELYQQVVGSEPGRTGTKVTLFRRHSLATGNTLGRPFNVHGRNTEKSPGGRHSGPFSRHVCLVSSNSPTESVSTKVFGSIVIEDRCKRRSDSVETIAREIPDSKCSFFPEKP
jgi:hypothetical protein